MPTFRHGKHTAVFINGTNMSAFLNSASSTMAIETAETTTFGDQDKTYITGLSDGTVSMSGFFDSTAGASDAVLLFYGFDLVGADVRTSTGNTASQDNAAGTTGGVAVNLHIHANTHDGTTIVKVQHSADDATWVDLVTFSTVGAATTAGENIAISGTVNRYLRASYTLAGSTGSVSSAIALARR